MKKISVGFRFDENIVDMLKHIAESDRRSQTATLEFLIESEYKKREKKK